MKRLATAAVCAAALVGVTTTASSHVIESQRNSYWLSNDPQLYQKCAQGMSLLSHGNIGHGFSRANSYSLRFEPGFQNACSFPWYRDATKIRAKFIWQRQTNGQWANCSSSDFAHNRDGGFWVESYRNYGSAPCKKGYYRSFGIHGLQVNGNWHEGYTVTPQSHYFDKTGEVTGPQSADADEPMPVVDSNGKLIRCPDGRMLEVSIEDQAAAPALGQSVYEGQTNGHDVVRSVEGTVARCAPAAYARKLPQEPVVWVPEHVGETHPTVAPKRFKVAR